MKLTLDQVKHVAKLANLPLTPGEEEKYAEQLSNILDYVDKLNQVNTEGVEPTFNVTGSENVLSEDSALPGLSQEEALKNASNKKDGYFVTKGVFEE